MKLDLEGDVRQDEEEKEEEKLLEGILVQFTQESLSRAKPRSRVSLQPWIDTWGSGVRGHRTKRSMYLVKGVRPGLMLLILSLPHTCA